MSAPKPTVELAYCDSDELIAELRKRYDRMLFIGIRSLDEQKYDVKFRWKDLPTDGLGLAEYAMLKIRGFIDAEERDDDDADNFAD